jgi:hypothetical protein
MDLTNSNLIQFLDFYQLKVWRVQDKTETGTILNNYSELEVDMWVSMGARKNDQTPGDDEEMCNGNHIIAHFFHLLAFNYSFFKVYSFNI